MRVRAGQTWRACQSPADFAKSPPAMLAQGAGAADAARRRLAASPWPAVLARGAEPPGTPAIGGRGQMSGFGVDAGSAGFGGSLSAVLARGAGAADAARRRLAASPWPAMLARGAEPPGTPAIGGR